MNKNFILFAVSMLCVSTVAFADQPQQVITLKNGSQIVGELVSLNNGVYTIKAPIIGNVQAAASDVVNIANSRPGNGTVPPGSNNPGQGYSNPTSPSQSGDIPDLNQKIAEEQKQLMSNPESVSILMQMAQDPEIAQLLQDPALVQAVTHHDLQAVESNPRIKQLMDNPKVKEFLKRLMALQHHDQNPAAPPSL